METIDLDTYIKSHGLRILCRPAFAYFYNHLGDYPGNYLEIGVFEGHMLRELSYKYQTKMIYGIDPFIEDGNTTGHNGGVTTGARTWAQMEETYKNIIGRPNIRFFNQTSRSWGEQLNYEFIEEMNISAVLVDGDHSHDEALNDMRIALRCLHRGGIMWVDDQALLGVAQALRQFSNEHADRIVRYEGEGIIIK